MKTKKLFPILCCFLFLGIQHSPAQTFFEPQEQYGQSGEESAVREPFSSATPASNSLSDIQRANPWGGEDAPDPEQDPSTAGERLPLGDGVFVFLLLAGLYNFYKHYRTRDTAEKRV